MKHRPKALPQNQGGKMKLFKYLLSLFAIVITLPLAFLLNVFIGEEDDDEEE